MNKQAHKPALMSYRGGLTSMSRYKMELGVFIDLTSSYPNCLMNTHMPAFFQPVTEEEAEDDE